MSESVLVGIILAAGTGERLGGRLPKQFLQLAGKPVLQYSVEAFAASGVEKILIVADPAHFGRVRNIAAAAGAEHKLLGVCPGGATRQGSTAAAIADLIGRGLGECRALFHDAARPLVPVEIIDAAITALDTADAVSVALRAVESILHVDEAGDVIDVPARPALRYVQTPQAFSLPLLRAAYEALGPEDWAGITEDCGVVRRAFPEQRIATVEGTEFNLKLTFGSDLSALEALLARQRAASRTSA